MNSKPIIKSLKISSGFSKFKTFFSKKFFRRIKNNIVSYFRSCHNRNSKVRMFTISKYSTTFCISITLCFKYKTLTRNKSNFISYSICLTIKIIKNIILIILIKFLSHTSFITTKCLFKFKKFSNKRRILSCK